MTYIPTRPAAARAIAVITLLSAAALLPAQAQGRAAQPERGDPLDAQVRVPATVHTSALARYRRLGDDQPIGWAEANRAVNRIGGWRSYAREAQAPEAAPAPLPAPTPASGAQPAGRGHHTH